MMFPILNTSNYDYSAKFYHAEFEGILSKLVLCYNRMISDRVQLDNDENSIRDYMLLNYLKQQWFKKEYDLTSYLFDRELPENIGRIDIRVMPVNPFISDEAYYVIECKRLNSINQNGTTGLNAEYISNGILRFTSAKYSSFFRTNGMIGFIVESLDINQNVGSINRLLKEHFSNARTRQELMFRNIVKGFGFSYRSVHNDDIDEVTLYHLMLDFSGNIRN